MPRRAKFLHRLFNAISLRLTGTITHVHTHQPVAALTFDDGPHPEYTPRLLDILQKHQARATFFMVGQSAQQHPEIVARAAQAGHAIGNHTWDHPSLPLISRRERRAQLQAWAKAVTPYGQRIFRPPYGHQSMASRFDAFLLGYKVITWNVPAYDWLDREAGWMADHLTQKIQPGSIIIFHDVLYHTIEQRYADREPMLEAVDMVLERLGNRIRFVTVLELLRYGRPQYKHWYLEADQGWLNNLSEGQARQYVQQTSRRFVKTTR